MSFKVVLLDSAAEFMRNLEPKLQGKALRSIELLRLFGPHLPLPHSKKLSGYNLWAFRAKQASNICRLFYFHLRETTFVVTSGYVKKSDKTKVEEIQRALRIREDYMEREGKHENDQI
jgi:phage-related protein